MGVAPVLYCRVDLAWDCGEAERVLQPPPPPTWLRHNDQTGVYRVSGSDENELINADLGARDTRGYP
jgi:hypothetical protein